MQAPRWKALLILLLLAAALVPFYGLFRWIERRLRPRQSARRFVCWLLAELLLVGAYSFALVLFIRLLFPAG